MAKGIDFKAVARAVDCRDVAAAAGLAVGRDGRAKCPWCPNPHNSNLAFYGGTGGNVYCHKCHRGGDAVSLAAALWHTSQLDAAHRLNDELRLGLVAVSTISDARRAKLSARDARRAAAEQAVKDAETERSSAVAAADAAPDDADAQRMLKNAEDWLRFKRCELDLRLWENEKNLFDCVWLGAEHEDNETDVGSIWDRTA